MKKYLFYFLILLPVISFAKVRPVLILNENTWTLNSLYRPGGTNRNTVMLTIPPNTVGLVYAVTTIGGKEAGQISKSIELVSKISNIYSSGYAGTIGGLASRMIDLSSSGMVNIYYLNDIMSKQSFVYGKQFNCIPDFSRTNFNGGYVSIDLNPSYVADHIWLGMQNPSSINSVQVTIEAVALVNEENNDPPSDNKIISGDVLPEFNGDVNSYISSNLIYPADAVKRRAEGRVITQFVINEEGEVSQVEVKKGIDPDLDAEAVRVIQSMPRWKPGLNNGTPVKVYFTLPITFILR